jgi:DNA-binding GntR family transcriptional regulator
VSDKPLGDKPEAWLKHERVYRAIRENMARGRYGPGFRLVIDQLARELGTSPIPVREAVRRLEAEGLVAYARHVGFQVVELDDRALAETLEALGPLEAWAVGVAARRILPEAMADLRQLARDQMAAVEDGDMIRYGRLDRIFHEKLWAPLPNPYAASLITRAYDRAEAIRVALYTVIPGRARPEIQEHHQILETIFERGPVPVLERLAREHRQRTADAVRLLDVVTLGAGVREEQT